MVRTKSIPKFRTFTAMSKINKDSERKLHESKGTDHIQNIQSGLLYLSPGKTSIKQQVNVTKRFKKKRTLNQINSIAINNFLKN